MSTLAPARGLPPRRAAGPLRRLLRGPWLLLIPAAVVVLALTGWPLIQLVIMSTQEFGRAQIFGAPPEFVGLGNYLDVLGDPAFWAVLGRSVLFAGANVLATMGLGIAIAVLLTRLARVMRTVVSIGLLLAWAMPPLSATVVWGWMFDTRAGVVNYLLSQLPGVDLIGHSWLFEPLSFFFVATVIITWQSVPFVAITVYAGLTQVPGEVLEAAQLDGTNGWQRFRLVTVPFVRPVLLVLLMLQIIWDIRVFTQIKALQTIGGVQEQTTTIGVYIYTVSTAGGNLGAGGAIAVILVLLMIVPAVLYIRSTLRQEES
ncbi:MAG: sugar ABC transporter permease [Actinomycetales bacterium]|nr:sugar ABC transporter permease [Actinomycetales bacterium]